MKQIRFISLAALLAFPAGLGMVAVRADIIGEKQTLPEQEYERYEQQKLEAITPAQVEAEKARWADEHNRKTMEIMSRPPVGFAHYDAALARVKKGELDPAATGDVVVVGAENYRWGIVLFLGGIILASAGFVLRWRMKKPEEPKRSFF